MDEELTETRRFGRRTFLIAGAAGAAGIGLGLHFLRPTDREKPGAGPAPGLGRCHLPTKAVA